MRVDPAVSRVVSVAGSPRSLQRPGQGAVNPRLFAAVAGQVVWTAIAGIIFTADPMGIGPLNLGGAFVLLAGTLSGSASRMLRS
jgi:hypothetical protein